MYKELEVPIITIDKIVLELLIDDNLECVVNSTSDTEVNCTYISTTVNDCLACIFHRKNIVKSIDYLIENDYVTKEEALQFILEHKG